MENDRLKDYARQWEEVGIEDDFIFGNVMANNPGLCRRLVQAILPEVPVGRLDILERQKDIWEDHESHGVRLDIYSEDGSRVYEVEMQTRNTRNLPKRSRYYGSMIDLQLLDRGEEYDSLRDVIIIFICPEDIFGKGLRKYTFQNACREDAGVGLDDGMTKIFLNASGMRGKVEPEVQALFDLMMNKEPENAFGKEIGRAVEKVKCSRALRREYMTLKMKFDEARKMGLEEGVEKGMRQGLAQGVEKGMKQGMRQGVLEKGLQVYQNCLDRGMPEADALAIAGISGEDLESAQEENLKKLRDLLEGNTMSLEEAREERISKL